LRTSGFTVSTKTETQLLTIGNMKTLFAIFALFVVSCYAAPAPADKTEAVLIVPQKGEAPIKEEPLPIKGDNAENAVTEEETSGEFWIPFWDEISGWFSKKEELPTSNNEVKMAKPVPKKPMRADFDDSHEFLEELNVYHFGPEESQELVAAANHEESRNALHKTPGHVKDALVYNKVNMPRADDYEDYGEYLSKTSHRLMAPEVQATKPKSTWYSWFGWA